MQIVNWRTHLKFPEEAKLSPEAKDLISKLLCNVDQRLGTKGAYEIKVLCGVFHFCVHQCTILAVYQICESFILVYDFQAHSWFKGIEWDKLYQMKAAFIPEVNDELDTQNFEKFEEVQEFVSSHLQILLCTFSFLCILGVVMLVVTMFRWITKFQLRQDQGHGGRFVY